MGGEATTRARARATKFEEPEVDLAGSSLLNRYFSTCVSLKKRTSALTI